MEAAPDPKTRPRRWWAYVSWALLGLVGLIVLALAGFLLWLTDERLTSLVQAELNRNLAGRFELGRLGFRLPARLELAELRVYAPSRAVVATLSELDLELDAAKLMDAELWVEKLHVRGLELTIGTSTSGVELLSAFAPRVPTPPREDPRTDEGPTAPLPIHVRDVRLDATVHLQLDGARESVDVQVRGLEADWLAALDLRLPELLVSARSVSSTSAAELRIFPEAERSAQLRTRVRWDSAELERHAFLELAPAELRSLVVDLEPRAAELELALQGGEVSVPKAELELAAGRVALAGEATLLGPGAGQHRLTASVQLDDLRRGLARAAPAEFLPRRLWAKFEAKGEGLFEPRTRLQTELHTEGRPAAWPERAGDGVRLNGTFMIEPTLARIEGLTLRLGSTRISAQGLVPFAPEAATELSARLFDPEVGRYLDSPFATGWRLEADAKLSGALSKPAIELELGLRPGALGETRAKLRMSPQRHLSGDVQVRALPLSPLSGEVVNGTLTAALQLAGRLSAPEATGRVSVRDLTAAKLAFRRAELDFSLSQEALSVEALRLVPEGEDAGEVVGRLRYGFAGARIQGRIEGRRLGSSILAPFVTELSKLGVLGDLQIELGGSLDALETSLSFVGPLFELELGAKLRPKAQRIDAKLSGRVLELGVLSAPFGIAATGNLDLELTLKGPIERPALRGRILAPALAYGGRGLGRFSAHVATSTGTHPYQVRASLDDAVRLDAELGLSPTRARARLRLQRFSPERLLPELAAANVAILVSGEAEAELDPRGVSAKARIPALSLSLGSQRMETETPLVLRFDGETVWLEAWSLSGGGGSLTLGGRASQRALELSASGRFDLGVIAPLVPALVSAEGPVELELALRGSPEKPEGEATLLVASPLRLLARGLPMDLEISEGRLAWRGEQLELEAVRGKLGSGSFGLDGEVFLEGFRPARYQLAFEGLGLPFRTRDLSVEANVALTLGGEGLVPDISGQVDLVRGRVLRKFKLQDLSLSREPDLSAPLSETAPMLADMNLDVRVESSAGIDVLVDLRTIAVALSLDTDLRLRGTPLQPRVEGKVAVPRGQLRFPAGSLFVTRGSIDFQPGRGGELGAELDLEAEGEIESKGDEVPYFVGLRLAGDLDGMDLSFSAQPFLEEREVLLLLLTGYAGFQGAEGDSRARDAALALAGTQLVGPVADYFSEQLDALFNLDLKLGLEVTGQGVRVSAQKDLTRRLRLEGAYATGDGAAGRSATARARFFILDRLTLESSFRQLYGSQTTGGTGADAAEQKLELKLRVFGY